MKLKWGIIGAVVFALAVGIFALAAEYGTQSDPLVSLSYITDVFKPSLLREAQSTAKDIADETNAAVKKADAQITSKVNEFSDRNTVGISDDDIADIADAVRDNVPKSTENAPFSTRTLKSGDAIAVSDGCEVLLRSGSLTLSTGSAIDTTTGGALSVGGAFAANHLYIASGSCTILAKGECVVLISGK